MSTLGASERFSGGVHLLKVLLSLPPPSKFASTTLNFLAAT